MIPRIVATPIAPLAIPESRLAPRRVGADVVAAALPGPGRDRLAAGEVLVVTTGQQPGLFGGPIYTLSKALSALAFADALQSATGIPVAPVFWAATDDTDFKEASSIAISFSSSWCASRTRCSVGRCIEQLTIAASRGTIESR